MAKREGQGQTTVLQKPKLAQPQLYRVLLHNDDYTPRMFVVLVLRDIFHRSEGEAHTLMMHAHTTGRVVAGVYSAEVAETKVQTVTQVAREAEFPLLCTMEPE